MEKKIFKTLIKFNHKFGGDKYVKGRISGIQCVVCEVYKEETVGLANKRIDNGDILQVRCTQEQYDKFAEIVERYYPGLCEFNYKESK